MRFSALAQQALRGAHVPRQRCQQARFTGRQPQRARSPPARIASATPVLAGRRAIRHCRRLHVGTARRSRIGSSRTPATLRAMRLRWCLEQLT